MMITYGIEKETSKKRKKKKDIAFHINLFCIALSVMIFVRRLIPAGKQSSGN